MLRKALFLLPYFAVACLPLTALAGVVLPQLGGGEAGLAVAPMKHADITLVGNSLQVAVDASVPTPLLRPLSKENEFDPAQPWAVLGRKAHNFQYGWNPSGFWAPPSGSAVWIEQLDISAGLEVYYVAGLPVSPPYDPIFSTEESSPRWKWDGFMTHNAYAVLNPTESSYQAIYRVYLGDETTGAETEGYDSAQVQFNFQATPVLTADFNDDQSVNHGDFNVWQEHYGMLSTATQEQGDTNADDDVDGHDFLTWQRQLSGESMSLAANVVPEPSTVMLLLLAISTASLCSLPSTRLS